jgi:hypothetical protein
MPVARFFEPFLCEVHFFTNIHNERYSACARQSEATGKTILQPNKNNKNLWLVGIQTINTTLVYYFKPTEAYAPILKQLQTRNGYFRHIPTIHSWFPVDIICSIEENIKSSLISRKRFCSDPN